MVGFLVTRNDLVPVPSQLIRWCPDIAFSGTVLSTATSVLESETVSFRVECVQSGHKLRMEALLNKLRLCSVASGQVRIRISDEPEFTVGPHGLFKLKPGVACVVENRNYDDAVLHVSLISET